MFDYAFRNKIGKGVESLVISDGPTYSSATSPVPPPVSAFVLKNGVSGIIRAFGYRMSLAGVKPDDVKVKLKDLIEQIRRTGDIDAAFAKELNEMEYTVPESAMSPIVYCDTFGLTRYGLNVLNEAVGTYASLDKATRSQLSKEEQAILDNYDKAAKEFFEAQRIRNNYFVGKAVNIIGDMLTKYGETLRNLDEELLNYLQQRFGVNTDQQED